MQPTTSCSSTLIALSFLIVVAFTFLGIVTAVTPPSEQRAFDQTATSIVATNVQVEILLTQTEQARSSTPTPTN